MIARIDVVRFAGHARAFQYPTQAQQQGNFYVKNFNNYDYKASLSNWSITHDHRGLIFTANYDGILIHYGSSWNFTPIKNNLVGLSVAVDDKNRIFVGTRGDFGFLKPDKKGQLIYHSLASSLPKNQNRELGLFWDIIHTKYGMIFVSPEAIVTWYKGQLTTWDSSSKEFLQGFCIQGTTYITQRGTGIFKNSGKTWSLIRNSKIHVDNGLSFIAQLEGHTLILGTRRGGFHMMNNGEFQPFVTEINNYIKSYGLTTGLRNNFSKSFILGTQTGGVILLNGSLQIIDFINESNGLYNSTINDLHLDPSNNLWVASLKGISVIELSSPWKIVEDTTIPYSLITSIALYKKNLLIGSREGLFQIDSLSANKLNALPIWSMWESSREIFIASEDGLYSLNDGKIDQIHNFFGVTQIKPLKINGLEFLLVGHSRGVSILKKTKNQWKKHQVFTLNRPTFKGISTENNDNIWLSVKFSGIYKITNFLNDSEPEVVKYDTTAGLPDINEIEIINHNDRLLFTTSKGFYHFNEGSQRFEPDSSIITDRIHITNIEPTPDDNYVISVVEEDRSSHIEMLKKQGDKYIRDYIPFRRLPEMEITAIYAEEDQYIWIAGSEGLFRFDRTIKKDYTLPFNTLVTNVSVRDSLIFGGHYYDATDTTGVPPILLDQPDHFKPELPYKDNHLTFEYSSAFYEAPERTVYSYYLENNEEGWSKWTSEHKKEYNNLSAGTYIFHVRSKNIYDTIGREATYEFTILPPWYQTIWAYIGYAVLIALVVWFIALLYTYRVRLQRRRLKLIVADRTYEVLSQKKEIERQKDMLQHQYEEIINQRDSIQRKNNELQKAQKETLQANEALNTLNTHLEKEVEKRTEEIKSALEQLQVKNKELDRFIYRASHDLRGPISRISGLSTLVKLALPQEADQHYIDLIEATARNMKVVISKLTQVHELNNSKAKKEPVDMAGLLNFVIQELKHLKNDDEVVYNIQLPEGFHVDSDRELLNIILHNLIENALVFSKKNKKQSISIEIKPCDGDLFIKVRDLGHGIDPEHIDKVFDMFFRGSNESLGSGLGLYLVKMAVERLGGRIKVNSKLNRFAEFTVTIPL